MTKGISTERVAELAGVEVGTVHVWVHRGVFAPEDKGKPRLWSLAETLAIVLFASTMRLNRTVEEASAEVAALMPVLGDLIRQMSPQAERLVLIVATLPDGQVWRRIATTDRDLETVTMVLLRRKALAIEIRDVTDAYCRVLEAHHDARRAKVLA